LNGRVTRGRAVKRAQRRFHALSDKYALAAAQTGQWTWSTGDEELTGLATMIFDSEENARAAGDRVGPQLKDPTT
jgi:hypothetical protein